MPIEVSQLSIDRLDFVSVLLAIIAVLFALGVFPLFAFLRYRAETVAREAVKAELEAFMADLEKQAISRIESMLPELIREYVPFVRDNAVDGDLANDIAGAQEVKADAADTRDTTSPRTGAGGRSRPRPRARR
ncbi:MAG: hypothetical protein P0Y65_05630 [Candidatus Devosia phytovorans]|uniref:Uncharacterized protein n=1 Tax=Candidatus Devosia phytovorans TaxID=3121372 RepID=A0AAJ6B0H4_9HYPH|nr:hypothetical protein [Devosia sp.]WEK05735.1 MAG: hypothetical protein P0Y65_05630 [Devosia sp.]